MQVDAHAATRKHHKSKKHYGEDFFHTTKYGKLFVRQVIEFWGKFMDKESPDTQGLFREVTKKSVEAVLRLSLSTLFLSELIS